MKQKQFFFLFSILIFCITFLQASSIPFTLDFESGDLRGWSQNGTVFHYQPTKGDNPTARGRGQPSNHQGSYWIGTYEKYQGKRGQNTGDIQGDRPRGTLTSSPFTIPSGKLSFLIGGGSSFKTRVELLVLDPIEGSIRVKYASGRNSETMHREKWDLTPYTGKKGKIRIIDDSFEKWGHINADDFKFSNVSVSNYKLKTRLGTYFKPPNQLQEIPQVKKVSVPKLIGRLYDYNMISAILDRYALSLGRQVYRESDAKPGTIISQNPLPRESVLPNTHINIVIAKQPPPVPLQVWIEPSKVAVDQGETVEFYGRINRENVRHTRWKWRGPNGIYGSGEKLILNTSHLNSGEYEIQLTVSSGHERSDTSALLHVKAKQVKKVNVPNLLGKRYTEAIESLEKSLLRIGRKTERESDARLGTIIDQNPAPGVLVKPYTKVHIIVAKIKPLPPLSVQIVPSQLQVIQGQAVQFKSRINRESERGIQLRWMGPNDMEGTDNIFSIDTSYIDPGEYIVQLSTREGRIEQHAEALLRIDSKLDESTHSNKNIPDDVEKKIEPLFPLWITLSAIATAFIILAGTLYGIRLRRNSVMKNRAGIDFHLIQGKSFQNVDTDSEIIDMEMSMEVINDMGRQNIEKGENIIEREWSSDDK